LMANALKEAYNAWPDTTNYRQTLLTILADTNAFL
jgi:hypothetical protein